LSVDTLISKQIVKFIFSLVFLLTVPVLVIYLVQLPAVGVIWDWANLLGYLCVGIFLLLFIYAGRSRAIPSISGSFFGRFHRDLGFVALLLLVLHIGLLLIQEPLLLEHLKLSAPWYMLSGLLAAILILLLVMSSVVKVRGQIWSSYQVFQLSHKWFSIFIALLIAIHIIDSRFYLNEYWKGLLLIMISLFVVRDYAFSKKTKTQNIKQREKSTNHTSWLVSVLITICLMLISFLIVLIKNRS